MIPDNFEISWRLWPAETPLHPVECHIDMRLASGRSFGIFARLHGADFLPPIRPGYKQRTKEEVEIELAATFLRKIGAA